MPMTHVAAFAQTPRNRAVRLTALGALDGSDATLIFTAGVNGALLTRITATATGSTTAAGVNVYIEGADGVRGLSYSATLAASAASVDAKAVGTDMGLSEQTPGRLEAGAKVYVSLSKELLSGVSVALQATDY